MTNLTCLCCMASVYGFVRWSVSSLFPFEAVSEVPPFYTKRPDRGKKGPPLLLTSMTPESISSIPSSSPCSSALTTLSLELDLELE